MAVGFELAIKVGYADTLKGSNTKLMLGRQDYSSALREAARTSLLRAGCSAPESPMFCPGNAEPKAAVDPGKHVQPNKKNTKRKKTHQKSRGSGRGSVVRRMCNISLAPLTRWP